jgi:hypothetical protein
MTNNPDASAMHANIFITSRLFVPVVYFIILWNGEMWSIIVISELFE